VNTAKIIKSQTVIDRKSGYRNLLQSFNGVDDSANDCSINRRQWNAWSKTSSFKRERSLMGKQDWAFGL
jgi:hypothetical protein